MRIAVKWKHSSGHIVEELGYFGNISDGYLHFYGTSPSKVMSSSEQSMPLSKLESVKLLKEVEK